MPDVIGDDGAPGHRGRRRPTTTGRSRSSSYLRNGSFRYSETAPVADGYDGNGVDVIAQFLDKKAGLLRALLVDDGRHGAHARASRRASPSAMRPVTSSTPAAARTSMATPPTTSTPGPSSTSRAPAGSASSPRPASATPRRSPSPTVHPRRNRPATRAIRPSARADSTARSSAAQDTQPRRRRRTPPRLARSWPPVRDCCCSGSHRCCCADCVGCGVCVARRRSALARARGHRAGLRHPHLTRRHSARLRVAAEALARASTSRRSSGCSGRSRRPGSRATASTASTSQTCAPSSVRWAPRRHVAIGCGRLRCRVLSQVGERMWCSDLKC